MKEIQSDHVGIAIYSTKAIVRNIQRIPVSLCYWGKDLPNRRENKEVDEAFAVALKYIYKEYSESMLGVSN